MALEKWLIQPGDTRVIDLEGIRRLKVGLVGGQVDIVAHDEPGVRIEVHAVTGKELRIEADAGTMEIDHAQLRWDNFLNSFRNFGVGGPKAEVSIAVPRDIALTLGVVSASALISGLAAGAKLNTVSGDMIIDGVSGDVTVNAVSGDVQVRELVGTLNANSVSGDVTATGHIRTASVDTASGAVLVDTTGPTDRLSFNTVAGAVTARLDDGLSTKYALHTLSGKLTVDGAQRSAGIGASWDGTHGALDGAFADVRANTVAGDITVIRRPAAPAEPIEPPTPEEW